MFEWKKICCATDFSELSRIAMLEAAELARRFEGELELVHVYTPPAVGEALAPMPVGAEEATLAALEEKLATWRDEAARVAGRAVGAVVLTGDAAGELVHHARDHGIDVMVVGTHGRRGLKRLVLGSVAERVVREAPCAVVVARPREAVLVDEFAREIAAEAAAYH